MTEEKLRLTTHQRQLRERLKQALLGGTIYFRGNDRSPGDEATEVGETVAALLKEVLPAVFDRFTEAAAKVVKKDLEGLVTSENLHGLTPVFAQLGLVRDVKGKPAFNTDSGPLAEVYSRIGNQYDYGITSTCKSLADDFAQDPYGWEFDMVRLLVVALVRAGKVEATSKGETIDSVLSIEARTTFENNNLFRQTSFRPKKGVDFPELIKASEAFKSVFGKELPELEQGAAAAAIRDEAARREPGLQEVYSRLLAHPAPRRRHPRQGPRTTAQSGRGARNRPSSPSTAATASSRRRSREEPSSSKPLRSRPCSTSSARKALELPWSFLQAEPDLDEGVGDAALRLEDTFKRETFFRELPVIDQLARVVNDAYSQRLRDALTARAAAYGQATKTVESTPGWHELDEDQRRRVTGPLISRAQATPERPIPIPELRADLDACPARLNRAVEELLQIQEGARLVKVSVGAYFSGGIESEEQLDASLDALRDECLHHLGAGKKVLIQ